jgi:YVTN family beta-propeller protein
MGRRCGCKQPKRTRTSFSALMTCQCSRPSTNSKDTVAQVFDAKRFKEVKRLTIGQGGTNIGFSKDGKTAFIAVTGANSVAVIDVQKLVVESQIKAGREPQGLIVR